MVMRVPGGEEMENRLHNSIALELQQGDMLLNRWVLIAEAIEDDGSRSVVSFTSAELAQWEAIGLLQQAINVEQAGLMRVVLGDD